MPVEQKEFAQPIVLAPEPGSGTSDLKDQGHPPKHLLQWIGLVNLQCYPHARGTFFCLLGDSQDAVTLDAVLLLKVKQFLLSLVAASCFCPPSQHNGSSSAHFPCFVQTRGANTKRVPADPRLLCPAWTFLLLSVDEAVGELPDL